MSQYDRGGDSPQDPTESGPYAAFYATLKKATDLSGELVSASHRVNETREALFSVLGCLRDLIEALPEPQIAKDQFTALLALLDWRLGMKFEVLASQQRVDPASAAGDHGDN